LAELQSVLLGCTGDACLAQARSHQRQLLLDAADERARAKALKQAGSLSENLMLEYAQGFPAATVAWGRGDEATIGRLIGLHNLQFDLAKRRLPAAARGGSNLLAHILATLQQAAGIETPVAPLASRDARVVVLVAHDTNLAQLGGLLDADWLDSRQPDEYPPGGALVFDLVRQHGIDSVRLSSWMPTPDALRRADASRPGALVQRTLGLPACDGKDSCPLAVFSAWIAQRLDRASYDPAMPALPANLP
jgi:4-phytase/acid phosphatase